MKTHYRRYTPNQPLLLPPSLQEWLPEGHLAYFISDTVDQLDLKHFVERYSKRGEGNQPYSPAMMVKVLLYGYATGVFSSRQIELKLHEDVAFRVLGADNFPSYRTIARFRQAHGVALSEVFTQVVKIAQEAGLVKLWAVAIDGSKVKANASKHKAMSYAHMKKREAELQAEVDRWLAAAEAADAGEDAIHGSRRGDEMPAWVADKTKRIEKIRAAQAELEAEAKAAADEERRVRAEAEDKRRAENRKKNGKTPEPPTDDPDPKAQRNFTDPESRILKTKDGYIQGWNAQAAVDGTDQIIVAHGLTPSMSDHGQLVGLIDGIEAHLGRRPKEASADSGYLSEANLTALHARGIQPYIATGRAKHPDEVKRKIGGPLTRAMRDKLKRAGWRSRYRLRKQIVEPVFGQIKQARGFRQFLLRGVAAVRAEWAMICTAHNLTKLAKAA